MGQTARGTPVVELLLRRFGGYQTALTGLRSDTTVRLTKAQIELMAEVEHNRWNMEKLLLGYRKPTPAEEILCQDKAVRKEYKNKRFVHTDIRPFCELDEETKEYDRCISECLPLVAQQ